MCGIYKITNLINNKNYIGQSVNIEKRWQRHKNDANNPLSQGYNYPLYKAFRKYGVDNFEFSIVELCSPEELNDKEIYYIQFYNSYYENNGYNQTLGGDSHGAERKLSESDILAIYDLLKNTDISEKEIAEQFQVGYDVISTINTGKSRYHANTIYPIRKNIRDKNYCIDCHKEITYNALRCAECNAIAHREKNRPNKQELEQLLYDNNGNFTQVSKKFNVTDNAIRRWCKSYNLPTHSADYKPKRETEPSQLKFFNNEPIQIKQIDIKSGEIIKIFKSIKEAERDTGIFHISDVINKKRKTAGGYYWDKV